ncbi:MAG: succinylglutamate desuccinylase/aspartoacylase family protein [Patescibacteria group bacterium]
MKERSERLKRLYSIEGLKPVEKPIVLAEIVSGHPIVAVTSAMHGDEETGVYIVDVLRRSIKPEKGTVRLIVANPPALFRGVRFIAEDLNRAFPGEVGRQGEAGLAPQILELVEDSDFTIDLHTTSSPTESFVILGKKDKPRLELGEKTGLQKIVLIEAKKDCAMVDFVKCGIGIELGLHNSKYAYEQGMQAVQRVLKSLGIVEGQESREKVDHKYYQVFGSVPKPSFPIHIADSIRNFSLIARGDIIAQIDGDRKPVIAEESFYPLFVGEKAYKDICLKTKRISREEMLGDRI